MKNIDLMFIIHLGLWIFTDIITACLFGADAVVFSNVAMVFLLAIDYAAAKWIPSYDEWLNLYVKPRYEEQSYSYSEDGAYVDAQDDSFNKYCSQLGITETEKLLSNPELRRVIRSHYKELASKWHPDKFASKGESERKVAEEKFKNISEAYREINSMLN